MPATVRLRVQLPRPAPHGRKPEYSQQELRSCRIISSIWQAGKTARYPSADSAENRGMDSLISGLYMSINIRRISIEGTEKEKAVDVDHRHQKNGDDGGGGAGGERKRIPPAWKTEKQERTERFNGLGV